jgi:hypothetical protein
METTMDRPVRSVRGARRGESGSALFVAVMMLVLMGFLGLAALERVGRDEQVAGFQNRARTAFYAAESGNAEGRRVITGSITLDSSNEPPFHEEADPRLLGDAALYDREGGSLPRYFGDPLADDAPIKFVQHTLVRPEGGDLSGPPTLVEGWWRVNVVGQSPDGSVARVEAIVARAMAPGS